MKIHELLKNEKFLTLLIKINIFPMNVNESSFFEVYGTIICEF